VVNKSLGIMDAVIGQNGREEKLVVIYLLLLVADTSSGLQGALNITRHISNTVELLEWIFEL
jgi:hypothetical protein